MAALLPAAEVQFIDADGHPYAGGTLLTYVPGTTTPKATWSEPTGSALNTNPVVLDSAGRAIIYGDGLYRTILKDADGNLVWDQPSSTLVSLAMAPVILAPTIADAVALLGIQDMIDASVLVETDRAEAAEAAETARAEAAEAQEEASRILVDGQLQAEIAAEIARAEAAEANLQAQISAIPSVSGVGSFHAGMATGDGDGIFNVGWSPPFATKCITFQVYLVDEVVWPPVPASQIAAFTAASEADARIGSDAPPGLSGTWGGLMNASGSALPSTNFYWLAFGY